MKFDKQFAQPVATGYEYWLSAVAYTTAEEAAAVFTGWFAATDGGRTVTAADLTRDRVRYRFIGEDDEEYYEGIPESAWFSEARGKGSKPIWVLS